MITTDNLCLIWLKHLFQHSVCPNYVGCNDAAHLYTFTSFHTDNVYYSGNDVIWAYFPVDQISGCVESSYLQDKNTKEKMNTSTSLYLIPCTYNKKYDKNYGQSSSVERERAARVGYKEA